MSLCADKVSGKRGTKMRKIGSNTIEERLNYKICSNQGKIYEFASEQGYDMSIFSKYYLNSNFCNNSFDKNWSLYHLANAEECLYELNKEVVGEKNLIVPVNNSSVTFNSDVAWWIGFVYKQLQLETEKSSKELAEIVSFEELCNCYGGLHTIDEEWATDIICKKHNLTKV